MPTRSPQAPHFYSHDCSAGTIAKYLEGFDPPRAESGIVAALVPHAGWRFSGAVAAQVFECIRRRSNPETFVLLGAVHRPGVTDNAIWPAGDWLTPFGPVAIDEQLVAHLCERLGEQLVVEPGAHLGEHSLEVQVPFIRHMFPGAQIVPIAVPPRRSSAEFGRKLAEALALYDKEVVVVGSTDLTHYGADYGFAPAGDGEQARTWMRANDERMIDLATSLAADDVVDEAREHANACGAGAVAATLAAARSLGAGRGSLVRYTTSHEVMPDPHFRRAVGYAGIVF